jgi:hypothetical protein
MLAQKGGAMSPQTNRNNFPQDKSVPRQLTEQAERIIKDVYLVGSVPADPRAVLEDISRSVTIVGRILEGLADRYAAPGKSVARMLAVTGSVLWGIVEVSVPDSVLSYLSRNWFKLLAFLGFFILVLGLVTHTKGMPSVGIELLVAAFLVRLLSSVFHGFMNTGNLGVRRWKKAVASFVLICVLVLLLVYAQPIANGLQYVANIFKWLAAHLHWQSVVAPFHR